MKKIFFALGLCGVLVSSCDSDYLDTTPTSSTSPNTVFESTDNAAMAVNGLSKLMASRYINQNFSGEGTIKFFYGDMCGQNMYTNYSAYNAWFNMTFMNQSDSKYDYFMWFYYYKIISNANSIIVNIDNASGLQSERDFYKAQALSFRAYSFMQLLQFYCHRWSDSNNGSDPGVVLRLDESTGSMGLSSMIECYEQIYADCDQALALYKSSLEERKANYLPDMNTAYAIKARAALYREDWATAAACADSARIGYSLMSNEEYASGFNTPNSEWIWSTSCNETLLGYYSYFCFVSSNSNATWCYGRPKCISKSLYQAIPETDIRKNLFLNSDSLMVNGTMHYYKQGTDFSSSTGQATTSTQLYKDAWSVYQDKMCNVSGKKTYVYAYMAYKFLCTETPGFGDMNNFRTSEMYLIQAEAEYHLNNETEARKLMNALTRDSGRDPQYECTATGNDLLEEIKLYRQIELWGEGFDWFDLKRWKEPLVRTSFAGGGNFSSGMSISVGVDDYNGWTYVLPDLEKDFNSAIKESANSAE